VVFGGTWPVLAALTSLGLAAGDEVTFTRDVAPILFENCTECHRPGQAAPFPLITYADARERARMLALVTGTRLMPPWSPVEGYGDFVGARYLDAGEIATIRAWAEQGAPEGDPRELPELPVFSDDWKLGPPDLVLEMPRGFEVPADGGDLYRMFPLGVRLEGERWLSAVEVRAGSSGVLHHLRVGYDPTPEAAPIEAAAVESFEAVTGFEAMGGSSGAMFGLGSYVVGSGPFVWPEGLAQRIPAGSDIVLNSHLYPVGKPAVERTVVGLYFAETPSTRDVVYLSLPPSFGAYAHIDIPPGVTDYRVADSFVLPVDTLVHIVKPHAHYLCRELRLEATLPDGERRTLFWIDNWRFEWQTSYLSVKPIELPAGTRLDAELRYDNSADNPANPSDPPRRVRFGLMSTDEMGTIGLAVLARDPEEQKVLQRAINVKAVTSGLREDGGHREPMLAAQFRLHDRDENGRVTLAEVPEDVRGDFARVDTDGDQVLVEAELTALQ
jgi:hypothetical protein